MLEAKDIQEVVKELLRHGKNIKFGEVTAKLVIHNGSITLIEYGATHKERSRKD